MANLEIAEMSARSGSSCGSLFLDLRFRELVRVCQIWYAPARRQGRSLLFGRHF